MEKFNPLTKRTAGSAISTSSPSAKAIGPSGPPKQKGNVTKARA